MIVLNLPIKRRWLDMIASGEKREEYRSADNKQVARAYERISRCWPDGDSVMILRNGYRMDSPALAVRIVAMDMRSGDMAAHPEWGEPPPKPPKPKSAAFVRSWLAKISDPATCPDSPRYKACGNGWATNQPRWILTRLLAKEGIDW